MVMRDNYSSAIRAVRNVTIFKPLSLFLGVRIACHDVQVLGRQVFAHDFGLDIDSGTA